MKLIKKLIVKLFLKKEDAKKFASKNGYESGHVHKMTSGDYKVVIGSKKGTKEVEDGLGINNLSN